MLGVEHLVAKAYYGFSNLRKWSRRINGRPRHGPKSIED